MQWITALTQGGSFAVLVYFLLWGLPKLYTLHVDEIKKVVDANTVTIDKIVGVFGREVQQVRDIAREDLKSVGDRTEIGAQEIKAALQANTKAMIECTKEILILSDRINGQRPKRSE